VGPRDVEVEDVVDIVCLLVMESRCRSSIGGFWKPQTNEVTRDWIFCGSVRGRRFWSAWT
jgi:hypothetical protein